MAFRPEVLFRAAKRAGMLTQALYRPASAATPFAVSLVQPDELLLGDDQQSAEHTIEYETAAVPHLVRGDVIKLEGVGTFKARGPGRKKGDGYFSTCELETA